MIEQCKHHLFKKKKKETEKVIRKRHLLNTLNEVSYFIKTHDSVKDIVSQNICHSHLLKAITFLHYMYQINDINNLIIHQSFFPSLNIIFVHVFKKTKVYKMWDKRERVERRLF